METFLSPQKIFDGVAVIQAAFTAAVTGIITSNAHGLSQGDKVQLTTATTLPAGFSLATDYYVVNPTTNTFQLASWENGEIVVPTDTGTGTHTFHLKGRTILCDRFNSISLSLDTSGSANCTMKIQTSSQKEVPDFNAVQSMTNEWDYVEVADLQNQTTYDGDDGIVLAGTDEHAKFNVNIPNTRWLTVVFTAWSAGKVKISASLGYV